ncbi:TPM domain-containing protein [Priestia filamentosa]|uniref:TPM domain-containing protein n=1 Tax=Priestia filamentosa TaxID=1402861 RepID=UPI00397D64E4
MKQLASLAFLVCFFFNFLSIANAEADIPSPTGDIYVQDFAKVLDDKDKKELLELGRKLEDSTKAQIAILTVDSLKDSAPEEYINEAFRTYKLGDKELNNGILILLAMQEKKIRIEVGYGLEGAVTDAKSGQILDDFALPHLKEGHTSKALTETYKAVYNEVAKEYDLGDDFHQKVAHPKKEDDKIEVSPIVLILIVVVVIILIILDFKYLDGTFTYLLINILSSFRGGSDSRGGGGGSSGGGGAGRGW